MAVEGFAIFELDEHGVALGGGEEAEGELGRGRVLVSEGIVGKREDEVP